MPRNLIGRMEALICTGAPGLYRVVTFFAVQHIYSLNELGRTASNMAIAQMAGFFTAIGWATLILVRVPAVSAGQTAVDAFYPLVSMAAAATLATILLSAVVAVTGLIHFDLAGFVSLLCGWSAYQVARHYFVAHKRYRITVAYDVGLIIGSALVLWICERLGQSASLGLAIALALIAAMMFVVIGLPSRGVRLAVFDIKGLQFGLTNFLSGGVALVFVPTATLMCGASFSGLLSLQASVTAIGLLLPRAISMYQLPELAKLKAALLPIDRIIRLMRRQIVWSNLIVLAINALIVLGLTAWQMKGGADSRPVLIAGLLLALQCAVGVMGMANSSVMMAFEKGGAAVKINIVTTGLFAALFTLCFLHKGQLGFLLVLVAAILVTILRNWLIHQSVAKLSHAYFTQLPNEDASSLPTISIQGRPE